MSAFDHLKKGLRLVYIINTPACVKDLMPAVLRIYLCKHHQFSVCWVAPEPLEFFNEVGDFVVIQRKPFAPISILKSRCATVADIYESQGPRSRGIESLGELSRIRGNRLDHWIMNELGQVLSGLDIVTHVIKVPCNPAFEAPQSRKAATFCDLAGLG